MNREQKAVAAATALRLWFIPEWFKSKNRQIRRSHRLVFATPRALAV
jgi:hypothetical protein